MKKKSLLLAIAAMSMAAVGVGTVGTFAWFQSTAAISTSAGNSVNAAIGVTQDTSVTAASMGVKVHLIAIAESASSPILTAWAKESGVDPNFTYEISATESENTTLVKGNRDKNNNSIKTLKKVGNAENAFKVFHLWAYAEHTETTDANKAAVVAGLKATDKTMPFEIQYSTGNLTNAEVFFYTSSNKIGEHVVAGSGETAYAKANEKAGTVTDDDAHKLSVTLSSLVYQDSGDKLAVENKTGDVHTTTHYVDCGYLAVRVDGHLNDHTNDTAYSATLTCVGTETDL